MQSRTSGDLSGAAINGGAILLGQSASNFFLKSNFAKSNFNSYSRKLLDGNANIKINGGARFINNIIE